MRVLASWNGQVARGPFEVKSPASWNGDHSDAALHAEIRSELGLSPSVIIDITLGDEPGVMCANIGTPRMKQKAQQPNRGADLMKEIEFLRTEVMRLGGVLGGRSLPAPQLVEKDCSVQPPAIDLFGMVPDIGLIGLGTSQLIKLSELIAGRVAVLDFWTTK